MSSKNTLLHIYSVGTSWMEGLRIFLYFQLPYNIYSTPNWLKISCVFVCLCMCVYALRAWNKDALNSSLLQIYKKQIEGSTADLVCKHEPLSIFLPYPLSNLNTENPQWGSLASSVLNCWLIYCVSPIYSTFKSSFCHYTQFINLLRKAWQIRYIPIVSYFVNYLNIFLWKLYKQ
jgi:hypothetical protein